MKQKPKKFNLISVHGFYSDREKEKQRIRMNRKDMILTTNLTGANLAEKLIKIRPDIPIILCTGYSSLIDEEKARQLGIAAYMMKPVSMLQIAKTIRKLMERK